MEICTILVWTTRRHTQGDTMILLYTVCDLEHQHPKYICSACRKLPVLLDESVSCCPRQSQSLITVRWYLTRALTAVCLTDNALGPSNVPRTSHRTISARTPSVTCGEAGRCSHCRYGADQKQHLAWYPPGPGSIAAIAYTWRMSARRLDYE